MCACVCDRERQRTNKRGTVWWNHHVGPMQNQRLTSALHEHTMGDSLAIGSLACEIDIRAQQEMRSGLFAVSLVRHQARNDQKNTNMHMHTHTEKKGGVDDK